MFRFQENLIFLKIICIKINMDKHLKKINLIQVQGDGSELCDSETSVSSLRQDMQRLLSAHNDVRGKMEAMEREMMWMKEGMLEKLEILSIKVEWAMVDGSAVPRNVSRFMSVR